jgi:hypothetical protein
MKLMLNFLMLVTFSAVAQTQIICTSPQAESAMLGNYDPALYKPSVQQSKTAITAGIWSNLSTDTMRANLEALAAFYNRSTVSDTVSPTRGIGAARRWVASRFESYSASVNNRLLPAYIQFNQTVCGVPQHRNVIAVLPGTDTSAKGILIVEAHMDSRCEGANADCDTICLAQGMEDNGSGSVLVMELARVMSRYAYRRTIVFMLTIGEEQGLMGANAFAVYCKNKGIAVHAVLNNDVVGGTICGVTSSPPSCPYPNHVDSTTFRLFSYGTVFSPHKGLARFVKLEYEEEVKPWVPVTTNIQVMNDEDRVGRGGDHIPFRQQGFTSVRFTSANEHGDGNPGNAPGYTDRQHSSRDVLGKDVDGDGVLDSLYVNLGYLKLNTMINGNTLHMGASGLIPPEFTVSNDGNGLGVFITPVEGAVAYKIGIRSASNEFEQVYETGTSFRTWDHIVKDEYYLISVASVDSSGIESLFAKEQRVKAVAQPATGIRNEAAEALQVMRAWPNPADETMTLVVFSNHAMPHAVAHFEITDLAGRVVAVLPVSLNEGPNEVRYVHGFGIHGIFTARLIVDGAVKHVQKLVFR